MDKFKKAMAFILAASSVAAYAISASASDFRKGDADMDGDVDVYDALLVLQGSVGLVEFDEEQLALADMDGDGMITANDSLEIRRYILGIGDIADIVETPTEAEYIDEEEGSEEYESYTDEEYYDESEDDDYDEEEYYISDEESEDDTEEDSAYIDDEESEEEYIEDEDYSDSYADEEASDADDEEEDYELELDLSEPGSLLTDVVSFEYPEVTESKTQVSDMKGWAPEDVIEAVGPLFTADQERTGILASVSLAQFIVESGYGQSRLSLEANNCFGIKGYPNQGTWYGSAWDGVSVYTINTDEQNSDGSVYTVLDSFRMYDCMEDSIADHSAYLATSMNGSSLRYEGIIGCTDYKKAAQIIKNGGYATAVNYVDVICSVIERWDLTQYDVPGGTSGYMFND